MAPRSPGQERNVRTRASGGKPFPGLTIQHVARTTSTQDVVRRAAIGGAPEGFCCVADEQTAGRGRLGRVWSAPPGSALLASLLVRRRSAVLSGLPLAAGLAVVAALEQSTGMATQVKWPNDVVVGGRKLAGLLCEVEPLASDPDVLAVAVGLGVNLRVESFPPDAVGISVHELTAPPDPKTLLDAWLLAFAVRLERLEAAGVSGIRDEWRSRASGLGDEVVAVTPGGEVRGVAEDIDDDGALLLRTGAGSVRLLAGDVHIGSRP